MRAIAGASWLLLLSALALSGCTQNSYTLQGQLQSAQQQNAMLAQRNTELQTRASTLDHDNQELETMLAQTRQQSRILEDQTAALKAQLSGATSQLARVKMDYDETSKKAQTLTASMQRRAGATITANNSLEDRLPAVNIPGVEARIDGDVIRLELPGARLFESGNARLLPQGTSFIDQVAAEVARAYPYQIIGIEGHTDSDPIASGKWASNHQLSVARAMAVYDYIVSRGRLYPGQLFVVGHGANHPVVSNGTAAGKERNRRVEFVIYPERVPGR